MTKRAFLYPELMIDELSSQTPESEISNNIKNDIDSQII